MKKKVLYTIFTACEDRNVVLAGIIAEAVGD